MKNGSEQGPLPCASGSPPTGSQASGWPRPLGPSAATRSWHCRSRCCPFREPLRSRAAEHDPHPAQPAAPVGGKRTEGREAAALPGRPSLAGHRGQARQLAQVPVSGQKRPSGRPAGEGAAQMDAARLPPTFPRVGGDRETRRHPFAGCTRWKRRHKPEPPPGRPRVRWQDLVLLQHPSPPLTRGIVEVLSRGFPASLHAQGPFQRETPAPSTTPGHVPHEPVRPS